MEVCPPCTVTGGMGPGHVRAGTDSPIRRDFQPLLEVACPRGAICPELLPFVLKFSDLLQYNLHAINLLTANAQFSIWEITEF